MKKILLIFVAGFLFQSCYSYKAVENNSSQYEIGEFYKVKQSGKSLKVKITDKTDSTLVVWNKFESKILSIDKISKAEKRNFQS